jgi:ADP-ribosyl-[dinitrogen reductase] hydrolase
MELKNRFYGSILGGIVGDAYGSSMEFKERDTYQVYRLMQYNTNFNLPAGSYTDDTSMMLCLMNSLHEKGEFDHNDQMEKYIKWRTEGYMSSNGVCFDIGRTCQMAIGEYLFAQRRSVEDEQSFDKEAYYGLTRKMSSGNGGIMRLAPIPIFYFKSEELTRKYSRLSSRVTHANQECMDSCELMGRIMHQIFNGVEKKDLFLPKECFKSEKVQALSEAKFISKKRHEIKTTGYVIDTLEAALWAFTSTDNYLDGLYLLAAMGDDVDTVCCVYGQIAGAYYGYNGNTKEVVDKGVSRDLISQLQNRQLLSRLIGQFIENIPL